ncbi:unnamed protein product, partial [Meganyctiphanes norvegica]
MEFSKNSDYNNIKREIEEEPMQIEVMVDPEQVFHSRTNIPDNVLLQNEFESKNGYYPIEFVDIKLVDTSLKSESSLFQPSIDINHTTSSECSKMAYHCHICAKAFATKSSVAHHIMTHSVEKPYICSQCDKGFSRKDHLIDHQIIHNSERPYQCIFCVKSFKWKSNLMQHTFIHTGERLNLKSYVCEICGYQSSQKCNYTLHMRTHTGEKPYKCDQCEKSFQRKPHLIQ